MGARDRIKMHNLLRELPRSCRRACRNLALFVEGISVLQIPAVTGLLAAFDLPDELLIVSVVFFLLVHVPVLLLFWLPGIFLLFGVIGLLAFLFRGMGILQTALSTLVLAAMGGGMAYLNVRALTDYFAQYVKPALHFPALSDADRARIGKLYKPGRDKKTGRRRRLPGK